MTSDWRKSSLSSHNGNCVEVAALPSNRVGVRDSQGIGPVLIFSGEAWSTFMADVKIGEFDMT
jgi:hypothetical protein